ncbi:hypothetical protein [Vibrio parahaemolyticus]|uniref:hypothetical protein n=1 Tax=Vibrio parahaemolyticus TaxID=670 RepID=UPI0004A4466B|nr:hypothetical protein [Vibrio parahaemolyticus]HCE4766092.1 hypothetical protein [Vibrio parahaemolyticus]HCH1655602.1 hypothetical protein [Vibrio parahaemolyticus]HCH3915727.1 hypothetical protein [Vibrio parahaemolyticus]HCH4358612.1 hypothetical protein [Vibrio parahaemolyticus]HCH4930472.1 hypothetical protein [Vibrio parahaemolyticus]
MIGGMKLVLSILEAMDKYGVWAALTGVVILIGYLKLQNTIVQYNSKANQQVELIKSKLTLIGSSYSSQLEHIVNYYETLYKHYSLCQDVVNKDATELPSGEKISSKREYLDKIDNLVLTWHQITPRARLILPSKAITHHEQLVVLFNRFNHLVKSEAPKHHEKLESIFADIHFQKTQIENIFREYLHTDKII